MVTLRRAVAADAGAMCAILNPLIEEGRTTAHGTPFDVPGMVAAYVRPAGLVSSVVAEDGGKPVGFQLLKRVDYLPDSWAEIATFVAPGMGGRGVGQHLWRATREAARAAGVATIDATIRADNVPGLAYYSGLGFMDYDVLRAVPLRDGRPVDRIRKRFDPA